MESLAWQQSQTPQTFSSKLSLFDLLPNETILKIFTYLDSQSLLNVSQVCSIWNILANEQKLWRKLCIYTKKVTPKEMTEQVASEYAQKLGWKKTYFWITKEDLKSFSISNDLCDFASSIQKDALKKKFILARGIELFPSDSNVLQNFADFLAERDDVNNSWEFANKLYLQGISSASKKLKEDPSAKATLRTVYITNLYRYVYFCANNKKKLKTAHKYFRVLLKELPGSSWIYEKYCEFVWEHLHKYEMCDRIYRILLYGVGSNASTLASYALYLWLVKNNFNLAEKCFTIACSSDIDKIYFYMNFVGRVFQDEAGAKKLLEKSPLYQHLQANPTDETRIFSLALAYHQIHYIEEAEKWYREHLSLTKKPNIYTLSNLAELLTHSKFNFKEAEELYRLGLDICCGSNETIEVALAGLFLASGRIEEGLKYLEDLLNSSHLKTSKNTFTEAWIIYYIHCHASRKKEALINIKRQLVTENIRPKLILMFDANLAWAEKNSIPNYEWMKLICEVYNCEKNVSLLDEWEDWAAIKVPPHVSCDDEEYDARILAEIFGGMGQEEEEEEDEDEIERVDELDEIDVEGEEEGDKEEAKGKEEELDSMKNGKEEED